MPLHSCWVASCDGCGAYYREPFDNDIAVRKAITSEGWHVAPAPGRAVLCPSCDGENE